MYCVHVHDENINGLCKLDFFNPLRNSLVFFIHKLCSKGELATANWGGGLSSAEKSQTGDFDSFVNSE